MALSQDAERRVAKALQNNDISEAQAQAGYEGWCSYLAKWGTRPKDANGEPNPIFEEDDEAGARGDAGGGAHAGDGASSKTQNTESATLAARARPLTAHSSEGATDRPAAKRRRTGPARASSNARNISVSASSEVTTMGDKCSSAIKSERRPGASNASTISQAGDTTAASYDEIVADRTRSTKEQEHELMAVSAQITKAFESYGEPFTDGGQVLENGLAKMLSSNGAGRSALRVISALRGMMPSIENVRTRRDPVCVAIFGGMGTGKSLLVNKLCGVDGLSKSAKTEAGNSGGTTRVPVLIKYSKTPRLFARLAPTPLFREDENEEPLEALERWAQEDASEDQAIRNPVWTGNESELADMHAALEAAAEGGHELIFFELHWPAPGLKDLSIHVMDLPGHNERDKTQRLQSRLIRALHQADVVLTTDTSTRGVVGKELLSSINEHGWLHYRRILPAFGVVQNLKTLDIAGWEDNCDRFRTDWTVQARKALDSEFEDLAELPHRDAKNIAWLKSGIRVEAMPDYSQASALEFKGSALYNCVDELCRDFRMRHERLKAVMCVRKLYQELYAAENSLSAKKYGAGFNKRRYEKITDQIKRFMREEKAALAQLRSAPATPFALEPWTSSWECLRALVRSETEQDMNKLIMQARVAFSALLKCMEDYFQSHGSQEDAPVFKFLQMVVLRDSERLANDLMTMNAPTEGWSDVVDALAKPITLWYENALGDLGTRVALSAGTKSFWAACLQERIADIRKELGEHLYNESTTNLDAEWRPLLENDARPTRLRSTKGRVLRLPTRAFKTIAEAAQSGEAVIARMDEFVKHKYEPEKGAELGQTRSRVRIVKVFTEVAPRPQIHEGILRIDATLDCQDRTLEVSSTKPILETVEKRATRAVRESTMFQAGKVRGPSLCPIVLLTDRQPRAKDHDLKPQLHLHDLVDFVNKRRGPGGSGPAGSFILFIVHEEYEVFERDSGDESVAGSAKDNGQSQNDDTLAKIRQSFMEELKKITTDGLPCIDDENRTWHVVEVVVKRRSARGDHSEAIVRNCGPKLGIGRLRSVAQLLMEKWLKSQLYYQLDDDIQCDEFSRESCMYKKGSCTTGRALAFLHKSMDVENQPNDDNIAERVSMLRDFKVLLGDLRDALGTSKKDKKLKKTLGSILSSFLEQNADLELAAQNEDELVAALSQFDGTDFGTKVGERARKIACVNDDDDDDDDDDEGVEDEKDKKGAKAIFNKMEERVGVAERWWEGCDTFADFLDEILGVKRCAHAALSNLMKSANAQAYANRSYDEEGAQMLHMKTTGSYPTHRVGLERDGIMLFNTSALRQILFVDDDMLFAEPMDPEELDKMLIVSRQRAARSKRAGKWLPEGRALAKYGYKFAESYFTRRLLGHGLGGIEVFKYAFRHRKTASDA